MDKTQKDDLPVLSKAGRRLPGRACIIFQLDERDEKVHWDGKNQG
jgi:hypothetical protein